MLSIFIKKMYLKMTDRSAYKFYKHSLKDKKFETATAVLPAFNVDHPFKTDTHFRHSGNAGDIIYALPTMLALSKNGKAFLHLNLHQKTQYDHFHPLGDIMLNEKMIDMLKPLLLYQPTIAACDAYNGQQIDYDLDSFRKQTLNLRAGSIVRWYFHVFGIYADTSKPWMMAPKKQGLEDHILIGRSHRYRSPGISYAFLTKYPKVSFIGLPIEFEDLKKDIPNLEYYAVNNFLETAEAINSCRLFIGNQSFPFAVAEALKVNRLLEVYFYAPNVIPEGRGAYDFVYQPQFESAVAKLYKTPFS